MKDGIHVFWLYQTRRFANSKGELCEVKQPVACVASKLEGNAIKFAVASHNPHDKFNRTTGRQKALGRLNAVSDKHEQHHKPILLPMEEGIAPRELVLNAISSNVKFGFNASQAARQMLRQQG